jgi:hypothetical protein
VDWLFKESEKVVGINPPYEDSKNLILPTPLSTGLWIHVTTAGGNYSDWGYGGVHSFGFESYKVIEPIELQRSIPHQVDIYFEGYFKKISVWIDGVRARLCCYQDGDIKNAAGALFEPRNYLRTKLIGWYNETVGRLGAHSNPMFADLLLE